MSLIATPGPVTRRKAGPHSLEKLTEHQRRLYRQIPAEVAYMPHESFSAPQTENVLFGEASPAIEVPQYSLPPEVPDARVPRRRAHAALTAAQEMTLFLRYNYAKYRLSKLLPSQRRRFSAVRAGHMCAWHERSQTIRSQLLYANLALVPTMAKQVRIRSAEYGELISEGAMVVLRCIEKFDVARGFKFSTYACSAIVKRFHRLGIKAGKHQELFPVGFDPELEHTDCQAQHHQRRLEDAIEFVREIIVKNHADLSDVERTVVLERYGIHTSRKPGTLAQVGKAVGLTDERVRQIQKQALRKVRIALERHYAA